MAPTRTFTLRSLRGQLTLWFSGLTLLTLLCVGLDPEPAKFPAHWRGDAARIFADEIRAITRGNG